MLTNRIVKLLFTGSLVVGAVFLAQNIVAKASAELVVDSSFHTPPMSDYSPVANHLFRTPPYTDYRVVDNVFHTPTMSDYKRVDHTFHTPPMSDYSP